MNPKAESSSKIFTTKNNIQKLAKNIKENYGNGNIQFVNSTSQTTYENLEEKIYAVYDGETGKLEIKQPDIFNQMMKDKLYKKTFQALDKTVMDDNTSTLENRQTVVDIQPGVTWFRK